MGHVVKLRIQLKSNWIFSEFWFLIYIYIYCWKKNYKIMFNRDCKIMFNKNCYIMFNKNGQIIFNKNC